MPMTDKHNVNLNINRIENHCSDEFAKFDFSTCSRLNQEQLLKSKSLLSMQVVAEQWPRLNANSQLLQHEFGILPRFASSRSRISVSSTSQCHSDTSYKINIYHIIVYHLLSSSLTTRFQQLTHFQRTIKIVVTSAHFHM